MPTQYHERSTDMTAKEELIQIISNASAEDLAKIERVMKAMKNNQNLSDLMNGLAVRLDGRDMA